MTRTLVIATILAASVTLLTGNAHAKWCAEYTFEGTNCGFNTYEQCRAAISGNGGSCRPG